MQHLSDPSKYSQPTDTFYRHQADSSHVISRIELHSLQNMENIKLQAV